MHGVNLNPQASDLRGFGWAMAAGFGVLGAILWYAGPEPNGVAWVGVRAQKVAIVLWCLGALMWAVSFGPIGLARPVYIVWMTVAMKIGAVMTVVLLSVLFVTLLPIFSLIRLADPLRLKLKPRGESYWEDHTHHESTLERTIRPF